MRSAKNTAKTVSTATLSAQYLNVAGGFCKEHARRGGTMFTVPPSTAGAAAAADATTLARQLGHTPATWQVAGHTYRVYSGRYEASPYIPLGPPPPPVFVEASNREPPREITPVTPDGFLLPGTRADTLLRMWLSPIGARPAATPLLLVGATLWAPVLNTLRSHAPARLYPTSYGNRGMSISELPIDLTTLSVFRTLTVHATILLVTLPSVPSVAAFAAQRWALLRDAMPQHSFVFLTADGGAVDLPARVIETFTTIRWRDAEPSQPMAPKPAAVAKAESPLLMVAASHLRAGGVLQPGLTAAQQLGLEPVSQRELAHYAMAEQAAAHAAHINALAGRLPSAKRMRLGDFANPARVGDAALQGGAGDFGRHTIA
jgi:hypothetical protein